MGALGGPLGLKGGAAGSGFAAPKFFDAQQGVGLDQTAASYNQNQQALQQQQGLLNAIAGQNGTGNQTGVFNQLGDLNSQLGNIASGQGPNPAQAMLNQQTGQNVQNQAALMAGQRGVGQNAGLLARQAAMQGANTQQQAVGQGAALQAQQSLGALGQQAGVLGQRAGIAGQMVGNQIGQTNAVTGANQAEQANLLNALNGVNQANVSMQSNVNQGNTALASQEMQQGESAVGGMMNAGGAFAGGMGGGGGAAMAAAQGGVIEQPKRMAGGGEAGPQSEFGQFLSGVGAGGGINIGSYALPNSVMQPGQSKPQKQNPQQQLQPTSTQTGVDNTSGAGSPQQQFQSQPQNMSEPSMSYDQQGQSMMAAHGGLVDVVLSPGEEVIPPGKAKEAAGGRVEAKTVPGKAKYSGDTTKNDTFKTKVPEGSIVVPRTKADGSRKAADFVRKTLAKRGKK